MAKSKLNFIRNVVDKLSVKGVLSEDVTYITYEDENESEQTIKVTDMLNVFKNQIIELSVQLKGTEDLDIVPVNNES